MDGAGERGTIRGKSEVKIEKEEVTGMTSDKIALVEQLFGAD